ncbi:MAG: chemotaxis protein CheX [Planctomycetaceae bacterium]|nr:MAG: chemotaxis protein CheX [Planctomycetaceae bacterium]
MSNLWDDELAAVASETFETLAFMCPMGPDETSDKSGAVSAWITFAGPFGGAIKLLVAPEMLTELATNMLGLDDESGPPTREQQLDALKELLNVICGNLLPRVAGSEAVFNVAAPTILADTSVPQNYASAEPAGQVGLLLDTGWAHLTAYSDQPVAQTTSALGAGF